MDCSSICLLALSLALPQPQNIQRCEYCMDVRLLDENCSNNLSSCMNNTADSVLYCLTIHEISWTKQVNRVVQCLSNSDFFLTTQKAESLLHEGSCYRRVMMNCDCATCKSPPELFRNNQLVPQNDIVTVQTLTSMNFDVAPIEQSSNTATKKEQLIETVDRQVSGKTEVTTANIGHYGYSLLVTTPTTILSFLILLQLWY